ncbi:GGDEF domain-containing protein [Micromonospora sp. NPDC049559]|uniref:putative bifunctional diguanylate cyclase/phosphodiesterase n=1 Tax=Micromonospora sp. NPDC049559 TaxID=3155923 RepID=UPI003431D969
MSLARHLPHPTDLTALRVAQHLGTPLALAALAAGIAGAIPPYLAVAASAGVVAGLAGAQLVRVALAIRLDSHSFGPCRGAGFLGVGALATGLTVTALPLLPTATRTVAALGGLLTALVAYLFGMLLLPGAATTPTARLSRTFDGLSLGVSLAACGWTVLPGESPPAAACAAVLLAAAGLPVLALTALRAVGHRRATLLCGAGSGTAVLGLTAFVALLAYGAPARVLPAVAVPLVLGPVLVAAGARRARPAADPVVGWAGETHLSTYPLLTVPVLVVLLAAGYHLVTGGGPNLPAVVLALAVLLLVVVREALAVLDVRRYARALAAREARSRSLVAGVDDLTLLIGEDLRVRWQSPAASRIFNLSDADVLGHGLVELIHPDDAAAVTRVLTEVLAGRAPAAGRTPLVTARLRDGHGVWRDTESTVSDQRAVPELAALVLQVRDVGQRRRPGTAPHRLAVTDQLTGLANRRELMRAIVAQRAVPGRTGGTLLVVDVSGIAHVNERHGRAAGDAVLIEAGRRLRAAAGADDVAGRLGGDEFAVVTVDGPMLAYGLAMRLVTTLTEPYRLPGAVASLRVSIGLAELSSGDGVGDLLRRADLARRRARQLGRNRVEWYDTYLEEQLVRRLDLERELPGAAGRGELDLVFQPVLGLRDEQPVGTEALLRWRSPTLGTVLPGELLPVAEDLGLIEEIGQWVLHAACRQLAAWSREGRRLWMAVNVSARELAAPDFVQRVALTLVAERVPPERLVVEVAEPWAAVDLPAVAAKLAGLRALGVRTALDDFGAGQTPLAQLRRLPVDLLKIDRTLMGEPGGGRGRGRALIDVVVNVGRRLGFEIVAEGLESPAHVARARAAGCRLGQGFALSRPAPAERIEAYLEEFPPAS